MIKNTSGFAGGGKTHVLYPGTTLVGPQKASAMRALAAATEGRTDVFPRGIRLAPEVLLPVGCRRLHTLLRHDAAQARSQNSFEQIVPFVVQRLRDATRVALREGAEQAKQDFTALGRVNTTRCAS